MSLFPIDLFQPIYKLLWKTILTFLKDLHDFLLFCPGDRVVTGVFLSLLVNQLTHLLISMLWLYEKVFMKMKFHENGIVPCRIS